jgi:hypothetical protein
MVKKRSALERVRSNPKNVTAKDLQDLLVDFGLELRATSGDHFVYKKSRIPPCADPGWAKSCGIFYRQRDIETG